jgi:predicted dehydrogenase
VAPSGKVTMACIGCGTQALRELPGLLGLSEIQFVAACDPVKDSHDYVDWSADGLRSSVGQAMGQPDWRRSRPGIPGGREVVKEVVETIYARQRGTERYKGCTTYADFRELLERESDLNAVWVMTPDHLHAAVAIAAMKKGRHVRMHKPLANRLLEARAVLQVAAQTKVATHFQAASDGTRLAPIQRWVDEGAIGTLREIHNWSSRPMWPQYATLPTEQPPVPADFDWAVARSTVSSSLHPCVVPRLV